MLRRTSSGLRSLSTGHYLRIDEICAHGDDGREGGE